MIEAGPTPQPLSEAMQEKIMSALQQNPGHTEGFLANPTRENAIEMLVAQLNNDQVALANEELIEILKAQGRTETRSGKPIAELELAIAEAKRRIIEIAAVIQELDSSWLPPDEIVAILTN